MLIFKGREELEVCTSCMLFLIADDLVQHYVLGCCWKHATNASCMVHDMQSCERSLTLMLDSLIAVLPDDAQAAPSRCEFRVCAIFAFWVGGS